VGSRSVTITNGATTIAANDFNEGYVNVEDDAGEGHLYQIESHDVEATGSANFGITLAAGEGVAVAWTTSTTVGITKHWLDDIIIHPSPPTAKLAGVAPTNITTPNYGWFQTRGPASVLHDTTTTTAVIARSVVASADVDGAIAGAVFSTAGTNNYELVGIAMEVSANTEEALVFLKLD
jgi:hypothetical protein